MRVVAKLDGSTVPACLYLHIFDAPGDRLHQKYRHMIELYRQALIKGCHESKIHLPFTTTIDLWVHFIDPCAPDYDHLLTALYQALDGKLLGKGAKPVLFSDDGIVGTVRNISQSKTTYK